MELIVRRTTEADEQNKGWGAEVYSLHEIMVGHSRTVLLVLLSSVGLVLLIGCVNIANLLLARLSARAREFAIRSALGAGRGQMILQLLTESLLLAALGGAGGIVFGLLASRHWSATARLICRGFGRVFIWMPGHSGSRCWSHWRPDLSSVLLRLCSPPARLWLAN